MLILQCQLCPAIDLFMRVSLLSLVTLKLLASVASLVACWPVELKVAGAIPAESASNVGEVSIA